jgi:hypothetical protein
MPRAGLWAKGVRLDAIWKYNTLDFNPMAALVPRMKCLLAMRWSSYLPQFPIYEPN